MAKESAADMVQKIRTETARRKRIWRLMRGAGHEAVQAIRAHAQRQGVTTLDWFGGALSDEKIHVFYQTGGDRSLVKSFVLRRDGRILNEGIRDATYEGYPDLTDKDPEAFKLAAVKMLMEHFNEYREQQRQNRRRRK